MLLQHIPTAPLLRIEDVVVKEIEGEFLNKRYCSQNLTSSLITKFRIT